MKKTKSYIILVFIIFILFIILYSLINYKANFNKKNWDNYTNITSTWKEVSSWYDINYSSWMENISNSWAIISEKDDVIEDVDLKEGFYSLFQWKNFLDKSFIVDLYTSFLSKSFINDEFIWDILYIKNLDIEYFSHFYYYLLEDSTLFDKKSFNKEDCLKYLWNSFDSIFIEKKSEITIYEEMNNSPIFNNNWMINQFFLSLIFNLYLFYPDNFYETKDISFLDNHNCSDMSFSMDRCEWFKSFIKESVWINSIIEEDWYYPNIYYINYVNNNITKETFIDQLCSYERN